MSGGAADLAAEFVDAINARDPGRLARLLDGRSEVVTGRSTHTGPEAIAAWARKEYDHLVRCYAIDDYRGDGDSVLALGSVQYVWSDGGGVADSSPIAITIEIGDGLLRRLRLHDDPVAALAAFES